MPAPPPNTGNSSSAPLRSTNGPAPPGVVRLRSRLSLSAAQCDGHSIGTNFSAFRSSAWSSKPSRVGTTTAMRLKSGRGLADFHSRRRATCAASRPCVLSSERPGRSARQLSVSSESKSRTSDCACSLSASRRRATSARLTWPVQ